MKDDGLYDEHVAATYDDDGTMSAPEAITPVVDFLAGIAGRGPRSNSRSEPAASRAPWLASIEVRWIELPTVWSCDFARTRRRGDGGDHRRHGDDPGQGQLLARLPGLQHDQ
jgi:hypothetical protein